MSIIGYVVIGIVVVFVVLVYLIFLLLYLGSRAGYKVSKVTNGIITGILNEEKYAVGTGGRGGLLQNYKKTRNYKVSMYIDGVEMEKEVELRKPNLKVGDHVEVRYTIEKNGEIKIFNDGAHSWLKQMAIGYTAGIIFSVIIIILKYTGIMD